MKTTTTATRNGTPFPGLGAASTYHRQSHTSQRRAPALEAGRQPLLCGPGWQLGQRQGGQRARGHRDRVPSAGGGAGAPSVTLNPRPAWQAEVRSTLPSRGPRPSHDLGTAGLAATLPPRRHSPARPGHALLLASHSLRSISRGSTTSSLKPTSVILDLVYSGSRYIFFSSAAGFFPLGFALDFLPERREQRVTARQMLAWKPRAGPEKPAGHRWL